MFKKTALCIALVSVVFTSLTIGDDAVPVTAPRTETSGRTETSWGPDGLTTTIARDPSVFGLSSLTASRQQRDIEKLISKAARDMRQAESRGDREKAEETLVDLLSKDYDARLESYAKELESLEEQLKVMKRKLQKRKEAKNEMIQLRIKVLEAEADDLGWPAYRRTARFPRLSNPFESSSGFFSGKSELPAKVSSPGSGK